MAFAAELLDAVKRDGGWKITVKFTDGADVRTESYRFTGNTPQQLKNFVRQQAIKIDEVKTTDFSTFVGKTLNLEVTPPAEPPAPTAAEVAEASWLSDWNRLNKLVLLANNGLLPLTDERITNLQASLKAGWLNSYLGNI